MWPAADAFRPVSGHRRFGLVRDGGSTGTHTRGAGRPADAIDGALGDPILSGASSLRMSLRRGLERRAERGGMATILTPKSERHDRSAVRARHGRGRAAAAGRRSGGARRGGSPSSRASTGGHDLAPPGVALASERCFHAIVGAHGTATGGAAGGDRRRAPRGWPRGTDAVAAASSGPTDWGAGSEDLDVGALPAGATATPARAPRARDGRSGSRITCEGGGTAIVTIREALH